MVGLDSYFYRKRYVKNWEHDPVKKKVTLKIDGVAQKLRNPVHLTEELAYWRKANHIHKFFVDLDGGRDECQVIDVSVDDLRVLVDRCKAIQADPSLAATLLPPQSGFFFGNTEVDEYYIESLKNTVEMLEPVLAEVVEGDWATQFEYQASW